MDLTKAIAVVLGCLDETNRKELRDVLIEINKGGPGSGPQGGGPASEQVVAANHASELSDYALSQNIQQIEEMLADDLVSGAFGEESSMFTPEQEEAAIAALEKLQAEEQSRAESGGDDLLDFSGEDQGLDAEGNDYTDLLDF